LKAIELKAKSSKVIEKEDSDDKMALFVKRFNEFMRKKKAQLRKAQSLIMNYFNDR
jgi:hypothetical protein